MSLRNSLLPILTLCACVLLAGCQTLSTAQPRVKQTATLGTAELQREADAAFAEGRHPAAELYYARLAERPDLPDGARPEVFRRMAVSAAEAGHANSAQQALSRWVELDPSATRSADYFVYGLRVYHELGMRGAEAQLADRLLHDQQLPWPVRARGGVALAGLRFAEGERALALETLHSFYGQAPDDPGRAAMERAFLRQLRDEPWDTALPGLLTPANRDSFPYALLAFEEGRRLADDEDEWPRAWKAMRRVVSRAELADKTHLGDILLGLERDHGQPSLSVALLVPLSGRYQGIGRKVAAGAGAAQWMLANNGVELEVKVINTDAPGWTERVAALPPQFVLGGGPLRVSAYRELEASGALAGRALFTFLPELEAGAEGARAWRFFPSRRDEVHALAEMAVGELGIGRLAIFAPDEQYGASMGDLFRQEAAALGGSVVAAGTYPPKDHPQWGRRVSSILNVPAGFDKEQPLPAPPFGAVFLPDGWSQARLLIPNFHFYDASDLVFLGPDLWSRALDAKGVEEDYFSLAVCPGAWWEGSAGAVQLADFLGSEGLGEADFWVALGYDFLHLSAALGGLSSGWDAASLNARLSTLGDHSFAMAPLAWDGQGRASQHLYLFTPTAEGKTLADPEKLAAGVARAKAKREKRMELWKKTKQAEAAKRAQ
ncbi:MAG: ABC transporter substrate-binding protein [Desulfovibrionaceae bacterium]